MNTKNQYPTLNSYAWKYAIICSALLAESQRNKPDEKQRFVENFSKGIVPQIKRMEYPL